MNKLLLTIAIILGLSFGAFAQGGLFGYGTVSDEDFYGAAYGYQDRATGGFLNLPSAHGDTNDQGAPLGGGALLLIGFGAAYLVGKNFRSSSKEWRSFFEV